VNKLKIKFIVFSFFKAFLNMKPISKFVVIIFTITCLINCKNPEKPIETEMPDGAILSAIKGAQSKSVTIVFNNNDKQLNNIKVSIEGINAGFFKIESALPTQIDVHQSVDILVSFHPKTDFIGIAKSKLILKHGNSSKIIFPLSGLSTKALEGKNEPPLADVVNTLGYNINLGWTSLGNHVKPDLQGDEIAASLFKKASPNSVDMIPVARYSPPFELPFGYYTLGNPLPKLHEVGILADSRSYPEHQTLYPALKNGNTNFEPNGDIFGFYTTSPSHDAYSEDIWNAQLFEKHVAHACRIYPVKDVSGQLIQNQYLVCFEEASNGDYQDYVFLVKNIEPVQITPDTISN
jgi:hypothetical protein